MIFKRTLYFLASLCIAAACLTAAYAAVGRWQLAAASLLLGLSWFLVWKFAAVDAAPLFLCAAVALCALGILLGCQPWLMICAAAAALAAWDLHLLDSALKKFPTPAPYRFYQARHVKWLFLSLGGGLLAALLGQFLSFQLPFWVMLLLAAGFVFLLERVWRMFFKHQPQA